MKFPFGKKDKEDKSIKMVTFSLYLPEPLVKSIDLEADAKGWSRNKYIRRVLEVFKAP